jgi:hypothetical protein
MTHDEWYWMQVRKLGMPPFASSYDASKAAWQAAQEQPAAPAFQVKGRTCVTCGHMKVWDVKQSDAPRAPADDLLLLAIQRLNSNPYSLMKHECIAVISELRDEKRKAAAISKVEA